MRDYLDGRDPIAFIYKENRAPSKGMDRQGGLGDPLSPGDNVLVGPLYPGMSGL